MKEETSPSSLASEAIRAIHTSTRFKVVFAQSEGALMFEGLFQPMHPQLQVSDES